jgi:hypothetical protein
MFGHLKTAALPSAVMLAMAGLVLAPTASASEWDQKTIVTFSNPVEISGKVLPAGTYVFKLLDSSSNRDIVQIMNRDENKTYALEFTVPDYRLEPADRTVITFEERAGGAPEALHRWFYPGETIGHEFLYSNR